MSQTLTLPNAAKNAWLTLSTEPEYLPGALALARSLRRSRSEYPLIVVVTPGSDASMIDALRREDCEVREVEPIIIEGSFYAAQRYANVWTKLRVWDFDDLTRAVFLDTDMLVIRNMDELFHMELPPGGIAAAPACRCNPRHKSTYPKDWVPENCYYTYAQTEPKQTIESPIASEGDYFNAGLLVFEPQKSDLAAFLRRLASPDAPDFPFAEQDFLNNYFRGRWRILPYVFNALKTLRDCHPSLWDIRDIRNIHYILDKPWQVEGRVDETDNDLNSLWLEVYNNAPTLLSDRRSAKASTS
ncbi:MAG: glycosyltransferase family 8 protein [Edaphobacter sp.]